MANLHEAGQEHLKFLSVYFCLKMTTLKHLGHLLRQAMGLEDPKRSKDLAHLVEQLKDRERELDRKSRKATARCSLSA
jgi:hypothetical protein